MLGVRPGDRPTPSTQLIPQWLHLPLGLGVLAVMITVADLYAVSAYGTRLELEGPKAWWGAIGVFSLAVLLGVVRGLAR